MRAFITKHLHATYLTLVLLASAAVYVSGYWFPKNFFWDENYHIASAQKYLDGVMYMEPHPPLGKLLMAAGEWVTGANEGVDKSHFSTTDYIKNEKKPDNVNSESKSPPTTITSS